MTEYFGVKGVDESPKINSPEETRSIFERLCDEALKALEVKKFKKAELANLAMAAAALETRREAEILLEGIARSAEEGCKEDIRFRILDKAYKYHCIKQGGKPVSVFENMYSTLRNGWLKGRLDTFVISGRVQDLPDFYKKLVLK